MQVDEATSPNEAPAAAEAAAAEPMEQDDALLPADDEEDSDADGPAQPMVIELSLHGMLSVLLVQCHRARPSFRLAAFEALATALVELRLQPATAAEVRPQVLAAIATAVSQEGDEDEEAGGFDSYTDADAADNRRKQRRVREEHQLAGLHCLAQVFPKLDAAALEDAGAELPAALPAEAAQFLEIVAGGMASDTVAVRQTALKAASSMYGQLGPAWLGGWLADSSTMQQALVPVASGLADLKSAEQRRLAVQTAADLAERLGKLPADVAATLDGWLAPLATDANTNVAAAAQSARQKIAATPQS